MRSPMGWASRRPERSAQAFGRCSFKAGRHCRKVWQVWQVWQVRQALRPSCLRYRYGRYTVDVQNAEDSMRFRGKTEIAEGPRPATARMAKENHVESLHGECTHDVLRH